MTGTWRRSPESQKEKNAPISNLRKYGKRRQGERERERKKGENDALISSKGAIDKKGILSIVSNCARHQVVALLILNLLSRPMRQSAVFTKTCLTTLLTFSLTHSDNKESSLDQASATQTAYLAPSHPRRTSGPGSCR